MVFALRSAQTRRTSEISFDFSLMLTPLRVLENPKDLLPWMIEMLENPEVANGFGQRARQVAFAHRGATHRTHRRSKPSSRIADYSSSNGCLKRDLCGASHLSRFSPQRHKGTESVSIGIQVASITFSPLEHPPKRLTSSHRLILSNHRCLCVSVVQPFS